jgi:hypothetical protein
MLTWKLWSALYHPPVRHPVFQRFAAVRVMSIRRRMWLPVLIGSAVSCLCYQATFMQTPLGILFFTFSPLEFPALAIAFNLAYGGFLTAGVSRVIAHAREQGIYEVLCLTPSGEPGINWAMCVGALHRTRGFYWVRLGIILVSIILFIALTIHISLPIIGLGNSALHQPVLQEEMRFYRQMFLDLISIYMLIAAFCTGMIQTIVSAVLVGIAVPAAISGASMVRLWSIGIFLLLQLFTYLVTLIFGLLILPAVYQVLDVSGFLPESLIPILCFGCFFGVRELLNLFVWRWLLRQLNGERGLYTTWVTGKV